MKKTKIETKGDKQNAKWGLKKETRNKRKQKENKKKQKGDKKKGERDNNIKTKKILKRF